MLDQEYLRKKAQIRRRLDDFKKVKGDDLFYELCFCLLTPQSSGFRADHCIQELKKNDFLHRQMNPRPMLKRKIRFHNNKSKYLLEFKKKYPSVKCRIENIKDPEALRDYLLKEIKGFGLKETHHFLRNIGYRNFAILDRHILKNLKKHGAIDEVPRSLTKRKYFEIEQRFKEFAQRVNIDMDELDLLFWSMETGRVFK